GVRVIPKKARGRFLQREIAAPLSAADSSLCSETMLSRLREVFFRDIPSPHQKLFTTKINRRILTIILKIIAFPKPGGENKGGKLTSGRKTMSTIPAKKIHPHLSVFIWVSVRVNLCLDFFPIIVYNTINPTKLKYTLADTADKSGYRGYYNPRNPPKSAISANNPFGA
ncbi:MAG: hypothetical protein COX91_02790, partial [Candidatus Nealsonbacteria bacterium CG_4_10_14_0_2_um_filter_39_15]